MTDISKLTSGQHVGLASNATANWSSTTTGGGAVDTGVSRSGVGRVAIGTGAAGNAGGGLDVADVAASAGVKSSGATAGVGYATGAGGAVSQLTSKATTVVLNKCAGAITTFNDALGSLSAVSFTLTNSAIAATDVVVVSHKSGGTAGAYICGACSFGAGSCKITIFNVSGGSLSEALVLNFAVIKGVAA